MGGAKSSRAIAGAHPIARLTPLMHRIIVGSHTGLRVCAGFGIAIVLIACRQTSPGNEADSTQSRPAATVRPLASAASRSDIAPALAASALTATPSSSMAVRLPSTRGSATPNVDSLASSISSTPRPELGRIVCGKKTCETGKEVCCRGEPPNEEGSMCIPVSPKQLEDFPALDALCDKQGTLLVACDESKSCGKGRACCEIIWGSGQNQPIVCTEPRPGELQPCDFAEPCVPGVRCVTPGARCIDKRCVVASPKRKLRCGGEICNSTSDICCLRSETNRLECAPQSHCEQPDHSYGCTQASDCGPGEFCGIMVAGGGCMHSDDGSTEMLCSEVKDCPPSIRTRCSGLNLPLRCAPTDSDDSILKGQKTCQCVN